MSEITTINHRALAEAIRKFRASRPAASRDDVLLLSPSLDDIAFVREQFPGSRLFVAKRETWDLNEPFPSNASVDVVIASNVFHYSPDPARWFSNILAMTGHLIVQDLIVRRRSTTEDGLCDDGDAVRYCFKARGVESSFTAAYDLSALDSQIEIFEEFAGGRNEHHVPPQAAPRHYCAVIRSPEGRANHPRLSGSAYLKFRLPALGAAFKLAFRPRRGA